MDKDIMGNVKNTDPVNYAIKVAGVSKTFKIPRLDSWRQSLVDARRAHEKISSLRDAFVSAFFSFHFPFSRGGQGGASYDGIIDRNGSGKSKLSLHV